MAPVDGDVLAEVEPRPANDSRNRAQVIDGGWSLDYPSANDLIGKLTCRYSVPDNGPATTDASEFCDQPSTSASLIQPSQMTDVPAATKLWTRLDHELTRRAIWLPTVTPNEASAGSSTPGSGPAVDPAVGDRRFVRGRRSAVVELLGVLSRRDASRAL